MRLFLYGVVVAQSLEGEGHLFQASCAHLLWKVPGHLQSAAGHGTEPHCDGLVTWTFLPPYAAGVGFSTLHVTPQGKNRRRRRRFLCRVFVWSFLPAASGHFQPADSGLSGPACSASCIHLQPHPNVICTSIFLVKVVNYCNSIKVSHIPPPWTHPLLPFRVFYCYCRHSG